MIVYQQITYLEDNDANEALRILEEYGVDEAIEHLLWDYDSLTEHVTPRSDSSDFVYELGNYRLIWNSVLAYILLEEATGEMK